MKEFKTLGYDWECGHEDLIIRVLSYCGLSNNLQ